MNNIKNVIIQAGGLGTRLKQNTKNKPKTLVPLNGKPILQYSIERFSKCKIFVIADYKNDVLKKYIETFYSNYNIEIIVAKNKGTCAGIAEVLRKIGQKETICLIWSDIILKQDIQHEGQIQVFTTDQFSCRYKISGEKIVKEDSKTDGVMGLFTFKDKEVLKGLPESGSFVGSWLKHEQGLRIKKVDSAIEIGTIEALKKNEREQFCRFFNSVTIRDGFVHKECKDQRYFNIHEDEKIWYQYMIDKKYKNIPHVYSLDPMKLEAINGFHCHKKQITNKQKEIILENFCTSLNEMHALESIPTNNEDLRSVYLDKTLQRVKSVKNIIPFYSKDNLNINKKYFINPFSESNIEHFFSVIKKINVQNFNSIHGDCTFSNFLVREKDLSIYFIDPRGSFGKTKIYGDKNYDWAKFYYSLVGNYDSINNKKYDLNFKNDKIYYTIGSNGWEVLEEKFFSLVNIERKKIYLLNSLIWFSLCGYVIEDYDSILLSFIRGVEYWNRYLQ